METPRRRAEAGLVNRQKRILDHDADREARAGIIRVVHVVVAVYVIDVDVIGVVPIRRPGLHESKPKAAVLEARISTNQDRVTHVEVMLASEVGTETILWNSATASRAQAKLRLRALSGHSLLRALRSMERLGLLLTRLLLPVPGLFLRLRRIVLLRVLRSGLLLLLRVVVLLRALLPGLLLLLCAVVLLLFRCLGLLLLWWPRLLLFLRLFLTLLLNIVIGNSNLLALW